MKKHNFFHLLKAQGNLCGSGCRRILTTEGVGVPLKDPRFVSLSNAQKMSGFKKLSEKLEIPHRLLMGFCPVELISYWPIEEKGLWILVYLTKLVHKGCKSIRNKKEANGLPRWLVEKAFGDTHSNN